MTITGCTTGSTHVEQQLREIKAPDQNGEKYKDRARDRPKERLAADRTVFNIYKGVKCFHFSKAKNIIVTGGQYTVIVQMVVNDAIIL